MYERLTIGFGSDSFGSPARLAETLAADPAARRDSVVRETLGGIITDLLAVRFNGYRALTALSRGQIPGPEAGLAKVTMVNAAIAATDLGADVVGPDALDPQSDWSYLISFLPGLKSAGGTEQILRNTIGERVLGLPPEPRLDKGVPFSELRAKEKEAVAG
jgi:alkylation response protein AidB-like acyl-CoA dehydrogenase